MTAPTPRLTQAQYDVLTRPISNDRVQQKQGQSHVEAWDIRRYLIRVFGYGGYDLETLECTCIERIVNEPGTITYSSGKTNQRTVFTVVYRAQVRLTVKAPDGTAVARWEDGATGDAVNQPSLGDAHDMAMKTALSQALKRCATNLGDQFGLSLYNKGSRSAVVQRSLVHPGNADLDLSGVDDQVLGGEMDEQSGEPEQPQHPGRQPAQRPERQANGQRPASGASRNGTAQQRPDQRPAPAPAQSPHPGPGPDMPHAETLGEFVRLVVESHDPGVLRRMAAGLGPRRASAVANPAIPPQIGEAGIHAGLLPNDGPVTLAAFIEACATHLDREGGMSLADAAKAGAST